MRPKKRETFYASVDAGVTVYAHGDRTIQHDGQSYAEAGQRPMPHGPGSGRHPAPGGCRR